MTKINNRTHVFTSESCSPGHPDKLCDTIADSIKDAILLQDPKAHVAVEVCVTTDFCLLMGEVTTTADIDYERIARETIKWVGYIHEGVGFKYDTVKIENRIHKQSEDINMGTNDEVGGSGDQGIIFGYACNETKNYMPLTMEMSREMTSRAHALSVKTKGEVIRPDIKSQVTAIYDNGKIVGIDTVVMSASHAENITTDEVRDLLINEIIKPILLEYGFDISSVNHIYINPTGRFAIFGPNSDSGLSGRKLVVDQYGGHSAVGGGTMQGKDPSKVDNSAALMARYIAKNIVASGLADKCQVQLAYAIGIPEPVSINIECFGTEKVEISLIEKRVTQLFNCTPANMIKLLQLRNPQGWCYRDASSYGWFGRPQFPWERTDKVNCFYEK